MFSKLLPRKIPETKDVGKHGIITVQLEETNREKDKNVKIVRSNDDLLENSVVQNEISNN